MSERRTRLARKLRPLLNSSPSSPAVNITIGGTQASSLFVTIPDEGVTTVKLASNAVTNAKMAAMAQGTIKGRALGSGTSDPVDLTAAQAQAIIGSADFVMAANMRIETAAVRANSDNGLEILDNAGNMGLVLQDGGLIQVGSNAPLTGVLSTGQMQINRNANGTLLLHRESNDTGGVTLELLKRRAVWGVVTSGDRIGTMLFSAADGTNPASAAALYAEVDGVPGSADMPGRLVFATTADGQNTLTEAARINSLQNLVIADGKRIETDEVRARDSGGLALYEDGGVGIIILDSSGAVLVNTTTALTGVLDVAQVQINKDGGNGTLLLARTSDNTGGVTLELLKRRVAWGVVTDGDRIGTIGFSAADSVDAAPAAQIHASVDGSPASNDMPGRLVFSTTADGGNAVTEAMRITSAQRIGMGNAAPLYPVHIGAGADTLTRTETTLAVQVAGTTTATLRDTTNDVELTLIAGGGTSAFVGTATAHQLNLITNNATKVTVLSGGNVGIANSAPGYLLHVGAGADTLVRTETALAVQIAGTATITARDATNDCELTMIASTSAFIGTATSNILHFITANTTVMSLGVAGEFTIKAGTSANREAAVGGVMYVTTSATGNVGAGEDDLASYSVPASTLAVNNDFLEFEASGTAANNVNVKTLRVRFGSGAVTQVFSLALTTSSSHQWTLRGQIFRTGAATQKSHCSLVSNFQTMANVVTTLDHTLSGAAALRVTGEATTNSDIVLQSFTVAWGSNNT